MAGTYDPITSLTLSSAVTSYTFSSIPQTFTDLIIVITGTATPAQNLYLQYNGDTSSSYSATYAVGDGSTTGSGRFSNQSSGALTGAIYTTMGTAIINVMSYSNSTTNKTALGRTSFANNGAVVYASLWRSTAAITSIKINNSLDSGTTLALYGVKAA